MIRRNVMSAVQCPVTVCIPHCMPRKDMASREPVVKAEVDGDWIELPRTNDVTLEGFRVSRPTVSLHRQYAVTD